MIAFLGDLAYIGVIYLWVSEERIRRRPSIWS